METMRDKPISSLCRRHGSCRSVAELSISFFVQPVFVAVKKRAIQSSYTRQVNLLLTLGISEIVQQFYEIAKRLLAQSF